MRSRGNWEDPRVSGLAAGGILTSHEKHREGCGLGQGLSRVRDFKHRSSEREASEPPVGHSSRGLSGQVAAPSIIVEKSSTNCSLEINPPILIFMSTMP